MGSTMASKWSRISSSFQAAPNNAPHNSRNMVQQVMRTTNMGNIGSLKYGPFSVRVNWLSRYSFDRAGVEQVPVEAELSRHPGQVMLCWVHSQIELAAVGNNGFPFNLDWWLFMVAGIGSTMIKSSIHVILSEMWVTHPTPLVYHGLPHQLAAQNSRV